jgi:hypothetical protein
MLMCLQWQPFLRCGEQLLQLLHLCGSDRDDFFVDFGDGLLADCFALEALRCSYICDCSPGFCGGEQLVQFLRLCGSARDSCFCFCC